MLCYRAKGLRLNLSRDVLRLSLVNPTVNGHLTCPVSQEFAGWDARLPCEVKHRVSLTLGCPPQACSAVQCPVIVQGGPFSHVLFNVLRVVPLASSLSAVAEGPFVRVAF